MLVGVLFVQFAHGTAGAARIRLSLRPLIKRVRNFLKTSGAQRGEIAKVCLVVIASAAKQSTYPLAAPWIASRSLSSGARSHDPLARNDGSNTSSSRP
jgi:hypothetical protein